MSIPPAGHLPGVGKSSASRRRHAGRGFVPAVLLLFSLAALLLTGPALLSREAAVCAEDAPDTWIHMWGYARARIALAGEDAGYFTTHLITYPEVVREPIAAFDPLMALLSVPLQWLLPGVPAVFNLYVLVGLAGTGLAGFLLISSLTGRRSLGLVGGALMAFNPFVYRQVSGGYVEYAWWGLVPLTVWLYRGAVHRRKGAFLGGYLTALLALFLTSFYCAAYYVFLVPFLLLMEKLAGRLRRALLVQGAGLLALLPLFLFWAWQLGIPGMKTTSWGRSFPSVGFEREQTPPLPPPADGVPVRPPPPPPPPEPPSAEEFLARRTLAGSVDLHDLLTLGSPRLDHAGPPSGAITPLVVPPPAMPLLGYEQVHGREWLLPLLLVPAAFLGSRRRRENTVWFAGGLCFLLLALGPFPLWEGRPLGAVTLPYAWLYAWLPGFSRLIVPGRAFLGAVLCLAVLAARGLEELATRWPLRSLPALPRDFGLALLLILSFAALGPGRLSLPKTPAPVPPFYQRLAAEAGRSALLELPLSGSIPRRMYYQSVHRRPFFRGEFPSFMSRAGGGREILDNPLVQLVNWRPPPYQADEDLGPAAQALAGMGFGWLVLHADGYDGAEFEKVSATLRASMGPPDYRDAGLAAWRLPGSRK